MEYLEGTLALRTALINIGVEPELELRDPEDRPDDATDIINLPDDLYLTVGIQHRDTPSEFAVSLNEHMPYGGDPTFDSWVIRADDHASIEAIVKSINNQCLSESE